LITARRNNEKLARIVLLTALTPNRPAYVETVDWTAMSDADGKRLRELGLCEGASIELLHRAGFTGRGAHACRVGRMIVAMRATHAAAITVSTGSADGPNRDGVGTA
jgi:ferrous iron transport protein A